MTLLLFAELLKHNREIALISLIGTAPRYPASCVFIE
jgi:hypothetical protein